MAKKYECFIEIGSSAVELTGVLFENGVFGRCYRKVCRYDGIKNNFFRNPEKLYSVIESLANGYSDFLKRSVNEIYLILPQRFFRSRHTIQRAEIRNGTVNKFDVSDILSEALVDIEDCEKLECVPIAYKVGDDYIDNPIGQECNYMELVSVSVGILSRINEFFTDVSKRMNVSFVYVPVMKPVLDKLQNTLMTNRSSRVVLYFADDYIEVCYCEMRAVIAEKTIEVGNSDFIAALTELCGIDKDTAAELLGHVNFNLGGGSYVVGGTEAKAFDVTEINAAVRKLYGLLAEEIKDALTSLIGDSILPVYMTGKPLCGVRGAEQLFTEKIGMPVSVLVPDLLLWNTTADYVLAGMIDNLTK
ncbi:MAG: hypothetical protein ACI4M8_03205 [Christensenellales bacterium]